MSDRLIIMAMVSQKDEAERLRLGVRGGWLNVDEAVAWADRQIEQASQPHPALIDLAMAHNRTREEVAALLDAGWLDAAASRGELPESAQKAAPEAWLTPSH